MKTTKRQILFFIGGFGLMFVGALIAVFATVLPSWVGPLFVAIGLIVILVTAPWYVLF